MWSFQWHVNSENARNTCDKSKILDFYNSKDTNTTNMIKPVWDFQKGCSIKIIWVPIFPIIARDTGMETIDLFMLSLKDEFRWIIKNTDGNLSKLLKKIRFTALSLTVLTLWIYEQVNSHGKNDHQKTSFKYKLKQLRKVSIQSIKCQYLQLTDNYNLTLAQLQSVNQNFSSTLFVPFDYMTSIHFHVCTRSAQNWPRISV